MVSKKSWAILQKECKKKQTFLCKRQKVDCLKKNPAILLKLWIECAIFLVMETNVCFRDTKRGESKLKEDKNFFIVDKSVLPEIFLKVMEVKNLLESKKEKTVQDAVNRVGISRSAFYKYRDAVHPLYENTRGKTVTIAANLDDTPGLLSAVLNSIATEGANILTINQTIPINGIANVTITIETNEMQGEFGRLMTQLERLQGMQSIKIIGRE